MGRCDAVARSAPAPTDEALRAAAAARRLDDTFRSYLAERGAKPVPLAEVTSLVTGVVGLRLAGDAVLDLWQHDDAADGDRTAARRELLASTEQMTGWYRDFAAALTGARHVPEPLTHDQLGRPAARRRRPPRPARRRRPGHRHRRANDLDRRSPRRRPPPSGHARRTRPNRRSAARPHTSCDQRLTLHRHGRWTPTCPIGRGYCVIAHWL